MRIRAIILAPMVLLVACCAHAYELQQSVFDQDLQQIRYSIQSGGAGAGQRLAPLTEGAGSVAGRQYKYKSPGKAFILSALVPGLGQYYAGSRIKPWLFFGADVATWAMYFKFHGDGNTLTDQYESFQRANWTRDRYADYLEEAYGVRSDETLTEREISHHLPTTETGQYFEMTGKYNQFAWGWEDARLFDKPLDSFIAAGAGSGLRITGGTSTPYSAKRLKYENMRHDANVKFDRATNMVMIALANRLISGFEAFFTTKAHNRKSSDRSNEELSQLRFETSLKSLYAWHDTPFLTAYYKF